MPAAVRDVCDALGLIEAVQRDVAHSAPELAFGCGCGLGSGRRTWALHGSTGRGLSGRAATFRAPSLSRPGSSVQLG